MGTDGMDAREGLGIQTQVGWLRTVFWLWRFIKHASGPQGVGEDCNQGTQGPEGGGSNCSQHTGGLGGFMDWRQQGVWNTVWVLLE